jgi:hypothetical protein
MFSSSQRESANKKPAEFIAGGPSIFMIALIQLSHAPADTFAAW